MAMPVRAYPCVIDAINAAVVIAKSALPGAGYGTFGRSQIADAHLARRVAVGSLAGESKPGS
jgi:hypothetical protein